MRLIVLLLILLPCLAFSQATKEHYDIYSQYLKNYQAQRGKRMHFVVRESTDYFRKYDTTGIREIINELRNYLKGDAVSRSDVAFQFQSFADTLKRDTTWMSLIAELDRKTKSELVLRNEFSKAIHTSIISNSTYENYFKIKDFRKGWTDFHKHYPKSAVMVEFSAIVSDGRHAVFYFIAKCGGLCGAGYMVFGYKENNKWKFIVTQPLWQS